MGQAVRARDNCPRDLSTDKMPVDFGVARAAVPVITIACRTLPATMSDAICRRCEIRYLDLAGHCYCERRD